jgi:hypothetical protein
MKTLTKLALIAAAPLLFLGACASNQTADNGPAYVVTEPNAQVFNRDLIRRMSILDDDTILIEEGAGRYYQATLAPGCATVLDGMANIESQETGSGIRRGTVFVIDGRTCPVMSLDRVERAPRAVQTPATTSGSGA